MLIMMQAHVADAWTHPADRTAQAYAYLTMLGGLAAPLFLWLAGLTLVLGGEAVLLRTHTARAAWQRMVQRGLEIFILAFLFRGTAFVFNPGGMVITLFRVDILNIMGLALVGAGLVWASVRSRIGRLAVFAGAAVAIAMVTPLVRVAAWVDLLPVWWQWYWRPAGEHTVFTLFPWAGFVYGGCASGLVIAAARRADRLWWLRGGLIASGVALVLLGLGTATLPTIYQQSSFWSSSPTFFAVRSGTLLTVLGIIDTVGAWSRPRTWLAPLAQLGRHSLLIYWIHVQLVYGWASQPLHRSLTIGQMAVGYGLLCGAMYLLIPVAARVQSLWGTPSRIDPQPRSTASA